ncbi:MAG: DUF362 domain-containing protein [Anaerolineae bacterium]|nr:DUF362 domain-containing protein [Anaerolineae bacterium]
MSDNKEKEPHRQPRSLSRRAFLRAAGATAAGFILTRCGVEETVQPAATAQPQSATSIPATATVNPPTPTAIPPTPGPAATATPFTPAAIKPASLSNSVAIGKANSYDRALIKSTVQDMVDNLGGLGDVVTSGDRVAIKTNLTGGTGSARQSRFDPLDAYLTHPEVVRALGELVLDAGAKELLIVEAVYEWQSYVQWGYEELAADLGATLIDLNGTAPYDDYATLAVSGGYGVYADYIFNHILHDVDAFMSVSKMKCHWTAGVTHTMKNLFGLVPAEFYRLSTQHNHRSEFHGPTDETAGYRVPRIIVDLNVARPIDFALIDGVITIDGGEGPWVQTYGNDLIKAGVLFAGKNPVSTDAVATAAQGFDPTAPSMTAPFVRSDNHLELAREAGLGTNRLEEIEVLGHSIEDVKMDFRVCIS